MDHATLIAVATGPVLLLLHAVYVADRYEKEPIRNMFRYVFAGAAVCIPAGIVELLVLKIPGMDIFDSAGVNPIVFVFAVFAGIAFVEEGAKRAMLQLCARRDHNINEPFDWIVYAVAISMGFALLENILYVYQGGVFTGFLRALTAVPEHALCGTFMGERLARAAIMEQDEFQMGDIVRERRLAWIEPAIWHGLYDSLALGASRAASTEHEMLATILSAGLIVLMIVQWGVGFSRVRNQQKHALASHRVPPILISRKLL